MFAGRDRIQPNQTTEELTSMKTRVFVPPHKTFPKPLASLWLASLFIALMLSQAFGAAPSPFRLLHSFSGPPNDGYFPANGTSLTGTGTTLYGMTTSGGHSSNGIIFKVSTDGTGYQILHHFDGPTLTSLILNPTSGSKNDGAQPYGTPVLSGSILYGTTTQGGSNGIGTVFKMNTDGNGFQILHHFANTGGDGYFPNDSLVLVGSTLYGTTANGGAGFSDGVVFKVNIDGTGYQVLHSFVPSGPEGASPHGPLLVVGSTIYGVTELGGTGGQGIAFQINTNGTGYQIIHTFTGTSTDGGQGVGGLVLIGSALYGMTGSAGANNVGSVYTMGLNGTGFHLLHSFAINEGWSPFAGLATSGSILYGMTKNGGANSGLGSGIIFQINPDGTGYQILHTFTVTLNGTDGLSPVGPPMLLGSTLYGLTQIGGAHNDGSAFAFNLSGGTTPPTIACTVAPFTATNVVGATHTLTATVTSNGVGRAGVTVTFGVIGGPNAGKTGTAITTAKGQAKFTYTGTGGVGADTIRASATVGGILASALAFEVWTPTPHDLTITKLTVTKLITLTTAKPIQTKPVKITFKNLSAHAETITDATMLSNLLNLTIESLSNCPAPAYIVSPRTAASLPRTVKPKQSFTAQFDVAYDCANDTRKSTPADPGHEDFRYTAKVNHAALDGIADNNPGNNDCPRPPNLAIGDKGCGSIDTATHQLGAALITDVFVK